MARPALGTGRLLEPVSDCRPRGMVTATQVVQNPAYRLTHPIYDKGEHWLAFVVFRVCLKNPGHGLRNNTLFIGWLFSYVTELTVAFSLTSILRPTYTFQWGIVGKSGVYWINGMAE